MKKVVLSALAAACAALCAAAPAPRPDWKLPVLTLKYELTGGSIESPDPDEDILIPSSLRNTVSLRLKEDGPVDLGLSLRYSSKDYLVQSGDYQYLSVEHDGKVPVTGALDAGYLLGVRWLSSPELDSDGFSRDYVALKGGLGADLEIARGTSVSLDAAGQWDVHQADPKSRQVYGASLGFTSRLGQWNLSARYRGEARLALGAASAVDPSILNVGSLSFQWDPNR
jgi:hypothetical protein